MAELNYQNAGDARREDQKRLLVRLFGPNREDVWQQLAAEIEARYVKGKWWRGGKVIADRRPWQITLDLHKVGKHYFTRLRSPFLSADGFRFRIHRKSIFTALGRKLGTEDIEISIDPAFDEAFVVRSNDPARVQRLLSDPRLRAQIAAQPQVHFRVRNDEGWFGQQLPDGVNELCFEAPGIIRDLDRLHSLFELFAHTLHCLVQVGSAEDRPPGVELR